jgi:hypothetical protein
VSGLQKRVGPVSIGQNAVSTSSLQPGAVGGWVVDANSIYTGVKTATGFFAPSSSITIGSDGHIAANKFRIDANGNAFFTGSITGATGTFSGSLSGASITGATGTFSGSLSGASITGATGTFSGSLSGATITGGTITIGSSNNVFKADSNGIYLGNATFSSAPFRVTTAGVLAATGASISGVLTAGVNSTIGGWTADSNRLYKEVGDNVISLRASDSPDVAPAIEIFAGNSLNYNECRILGYGILFENFNNPNTISAVYQAAGVSLDNPANGWSSSLTASGLSVFGPGGASSSVGTNVLSTTGPVSVGVDQSIITTRFSVSTSATTMRLGNFGGIFEYIGKPSSSIVYKENVQDIEDPVSIIKKVKPRQFTWKPSDPDNQDEVALKQLDTSFGFIVEELLEDEKRLLCWESPREKAGKGVQSVEELNEWVPFYWRESDMIALLTATVKDLIQRIEQLENSN